jgi:ABC-type polysaccharide/polyol phosphate transport system ATPase subunit
MHGQLDLQESDSATSRFPPAPSHEPLVELEGVCLDIPVEGIGSRTLKAALVSGLTGGLLNRQTGGSLAVQALRDLNFTIRKGERVALLGHNGAGKSTLLRMLTDVYRPTRGLIRRHGQVVPLINKSFWVEPDLSGRHAAKAQYLLNRNTIRGFDAFLEELMEFTQLADFIHLPIRTYSEGMRTRLQFGLLTAFRHEALALDEGIGAGDQWFLSRARERLGQFLGEVGTLILASHSNELLNQFCSRGIVLSHGSIVFDGPIHEAFAAYTGEMVTP